MYCLISKIINKRKEVYHFLLLKNSGHPLFQSVLIKTIKELNYYRTTPLALYNLHFKMLKMYSIKPHSKMSSGPCRIFIMSFLSLSLFYCLYISGYISTTTTIQTYIFKLFVTLFSCLAIYIIKVTFFDNSVHLLSL